LKHKLLIFDGPKVDTAVYPVNSAGNDVLVVESAQLFLAVLLLHLQKLTDSGQSQLAIVLADNSDIVLHQHSLQLSKMLLHRKKITFELA
jgi:hypothetical protein